MSIVVESPQRCVALSSVAPPNYEGGSRLYPCAPLAPILRSGEPRLCALSARSWSTITIPQSSTLDCIHRCSKRSFLCVSSRTGTIGATGADKDANEREYKYAAYLQVRDTKPTQEVTRGYVWCLARACKERYQAAPVTAPGSIRLQPRWRAELAPPPPVYHPSHSRRERVWVAKSQTVKLYGVQKGTVRYLQPAIVELLLSSVRRRSIPTV